MPSLSTPSASVVSALRRSEVLSWWEGETSSPLPAATTAEYGGGRTSVGSPRPCSTLPSSWVGGGADALVVFCLEARRLLNNTASAMRAAPATAETIPPTVGVESEVDVCSGVDVVTGLVVEVTPNEGAGVGVGEVAANYRVGAEVGTGGAKRTGCFNGAKGKAGQFHETLFYCSLISKSSKKTSINSGSCQNPESEVQAHHLITTNPTELFSSADLAFF